MDRTVDQNSLDAAAAEPRRRMAAEDVRLRSAISLGAMGACVALVAVLHVIQPEFDPSWRFLSEYSTGAYGWVMMLAFFSWAASCVALWSALRDDITSPAGRFGRAVLMTVGVSLLAAGLFAQDPVTARPDEHTTQGALHAVAAMLGIPGTPIAAVLISLGLRRDPAWFGRSRLLIGLAHLTWLSLAAMFAYLAVAVPAAGGFGPGVYAGWTNRVVVLTYCAWLAVAAYSSHRIHETRAPGL